MTKAGLMTTVEAAEYLGMEPNTLEIWRSTQRYNLPFVKMGRWVKYKKADLDAFIESRTVRLDEKGGRGGCVRASK